MPKRSLFVILAALLVVALLPGAATAKKDGGDNQIYLSLGTSLSAGTLADQNGVSQPFTNKSFTDRLYPRLRQHFGGQLQHVKLGCPGETTNSMMHGEFVLGRDDPPDGNAFLGVPTPSPCSAAGFDTYDSGTQLGDAIALLESEADVVLITIDIGANDALRTLAGCGVDAGCINTGLGFSLGNLAAILTAIRGTGYSGPIIGMNYYNPNLAAIVNEDVDTGGLDPSIYAALTNGLTVGYNAGLEATYGFFGAQVADIEAAFDTTNFDDDDGNGVPDNVDMICDLTDMCPPKPGAAPNIHPNPKGYAFMSRVFLAALE